MGQEMPSAASNSQSPATTQSIPPLKQGAGVLFLTNALHLGGVTTHMLALGTGLMRRGLRVGVITRVFDEDKPFGRRFYEAAGFRVFQTDAPGYAIGPAQLTKTWRGIRAIRRHIRDFNADLLHVHAPALCVLARFCGVPYLSTFNINVNGPKKIAIAKIANALLRAPFGTRVIAISRSLEKDLNSVLHIPTERIRRTAYTVDESQFPPATLEQKAAARLKFSIPDGTMVVCMLAALTERKNHKLFLDALALARRQGSNLIALLAGTGYGSEPQQIQDYAKSLGLAGDVARFIGHQPPLSVYHASDVCVLPSFQEGMPLTTIESMHCGLVPIRTPAEGADEQIVDGDTGYIVPFGQPAVFADRLIRLAKDVELRNRLAAAAHDRAATLFSVEKMTAETINVYAEALADN